MIVQTQPVLRLDPCRNNPTRSTPVLYLEISASLNLLLGPSSFRVSRRVQLYVYIYMYIRIIKQASSWGRMLLSFEKSFWRYLTTCCRKYWLPQYCYYLPPHFPWLGFHCASSGLRGIVRGWRFELLVQTLSGMKGMVVVLLPGDT